MSKLLMEMVTDRDEHIGWAFYCPGCKYMHHYNTVRLTAEGPCWQFDGNIESPTFTPSLLVGPNTPKSRCHLYVKAGRIEYLSDCWHDLRGQTVDMIDLESLHDANN